MRFLKPLLGSFFFLISFTLISYTKADDAVGTADEAVALVEKALLFLDKNGKEASYKKFSDPEDKTFRHKDLYIFVITLDGKGTFVAHGSKPILIGRDMIELKDARGTPLVKEFVTVAKGKKEGWVDYYWPHPITKKNMSKSSFIKNYKDEVLVGAGIYKK